MSQQEVLGLIGEKCGMTQVFNADGQAIPVTVLAVEPMTVTQVKTEATDGYNAVQVGYVAGKEKHVNKPAQGIFKKAGSELFRHTKEFRLNATDVANYQAGKEIDIAGLFQPGDKVKVTGTSIGKGFQGTIAAHGFARGPMSHGSKSHRLPGSIGAGTTPGRVTKGQKMAKNVGNKTSSVMNLEVVDVMQVDDAKVPTGQRLLLLIAGAVPGKPGALLTVTPFIRVGSSAN
jgi:large subunit ribosomal protein L3